MYRIKQLREEKNLSQRALAKEVGASFKAVNFWESGKADPSARFICALADAFECTSDYLLGREDYAGNINIVKTVSDRDKRILDLFGKLNEEQRKEVENFAQFVLSKK